MTAEQAARYLWGARRAAERIAPFTVGRDLASYLADEMLRAAVERQFGIRRGAQRAARVGPSLAVRIPELARIVAFRNVLIHGHATVDDRLV